MSHNVRPPDVPARKPRRKVGGIIAGLVAGLIIVGGGGTLLYFALRPRPADAVEEFIEAAQARDLDRVKAVCSANTLALMNQFPESVIRRALDRLVADPDVAYEIGPTVQDEAGARVEVRFPEAESGPRTIQFRVVREDGEWKVDVVATALPLMSQLAPLVGAQLGLPELRPARNDAPTASEEPHTRATRE